MFPHTQKAVELPSPGKLAKEKMIYCEKMTLCLRVSLNWKKYMRTRK